MKPDDEQGLRSMATALPWRDGNAVTPVQRTTIVYDRGSNTVTSTEPIGSGSGPTVRPSAVTTDQVQKAMQEAQRAVQQSTGGQPRPTANP